MKVKNEERVMSRRNEDNAKSNVDVKINKRCRCGDVKTQSSSVLRSQ